MENQEIMRLIDKKYTEHPSYGVWGMTEWLRREMGHETNPKWVCRLCDC